MKKCNKCNKIKPLDAFYKSNKYIGGYKHQCGACIMTLRKPRTPEQKARADIYAREYRINNLSKVEAYKKEWRKKNKDKVAMQRHRQLKKRHELLHGTPYVPLKKREKKRKPYVSKKIRAQQIRDAYHLNDARIKDINDFVVKPIFSRKERETPSVGRPHGEYIRSTYHELLKKQYGVKFANYVRNRRRHSTTFNITPEEIAYQRTIHGVIKETDNE